MAAPWQLQPSRCGSWCSLSPPRSLRGAAPGSGCSWARWRHCMACARANALLLGSPMFWVMTEDALQLCACDCLAGLSPVFELATEDGFGPSIGCDKRQSPTAGGRGSAAVPPSCGAQAPALPLNTSKFVKAVSAVLQWGRRVAPTPPSLARDIATHPPQNSLGFSVLPVPCCQSL